MKCSKSLHSTIDRRFLANLLFKTMCKVNILAISLFSIPVTCTPPFLLLPLLVLFECFFFLFFFNFKLICDYIAPFVDSNKGTSSLRHLT